METNFTLRRKVAMLRERGCSYQKIAALFNLWRIETGTGKGKWHPKTVRELTLL